MPTQHSHRGMQLGLPILPGGLVLPAPVITAPTEMQFLNAAQLTLEWDAVDGALTYEVEIATDSGFSTIVDSDDAVATTSFSLAGLDPTDGQHWARVRVKTPVESNWSATRSFSLYWLDDEFVTDQAPTISSPRTAEPGPGQLYVQDHSTGRWEIDGGVIETTAAPSTGVAAVLATPSTFPRTVGLAFKHRTAQNAQGGGPNEFVSPDFGWSSSQASGAAANLLGVTYFGNNTQLHYLQQSVVSLQGIDTAAPGTFYTHTHIMRSTGVFNVIGDRLGFVAIIGNAAMYPFVGQLSLNRHTPIIDYMRVARLGGPWADDYGIATTRLAGARSVSDLFTHEAGALWLEFTVTTLPASGEITINFRRQDNNNCWQLTLDSTGAFVLNEVVSGTPTARLLATGCQADDRLMCVMDGSSARLLRWRPGGTGSSNTSMYTSVATFTTQTQGEIVSLGSGGAISDLITWPRVLSGEALAWIQAL